VVAIIINCILVYALSKGAVWLEGLLGEGGLNILKKVFGETLLVLSVKLFSEKALQLSI
jgi:multiple antibiotic resistance protein